MFSASVSPHHNRSRLLHLSLAVGLFAELSSSLPAAARQGKPVHAAESHLPETPPLPAPRPPERQPEPATPAAKGDEDCLATMRALGWDAEPATIDATQTQCNIATPVRLSRLQLRGAIPRTIEFPDRPVLACNFAIRFGQWAGDLAAPLTLGRLGTELKAIQTGPGFECRTRNRVPNAKISAHGSGIAVDIAGFVLANGRHVAVTESSNVVDAQLLSALRTSACGWFTTILGPGTDPEHATHWHFDILKHGSSDNYRICQ